jgi:hypothetical protein
MASKAAAPEAESFFDTEPFWVIWQASIPAGGTNRIRRITQNYASASRAEADAERFRKSGAVTWVEEARPLAPLNVPPAALDALRGVAPAARRESVTAIGGGA